MSRHNRFFRAAVGLVLTVTLLATRAATAQETEPLVVHEWGTFTALQDESGQALGGINIDDEPLPRFVHNLAPRVLAPSRSRYPVFMKGAPPSHPYVTLRLETPVMYFYRPGAIGRPSARSPLKVDVKVALRGGWLTEFYPQAEVTAPGLRQKRFEFGPITPSTVGTLEWKQLGVGTAGAGPATDAHVWTAPRKVDSTGITAASGESERYLFYRGVGNFNAPLRARYSHEEKRLSIFASAGAVEGASLAIDGLWLVHVREGGAAAFRTLPPGSISNDPDRVVSEGRLDFAEQDYQPDNLTLLRTTMHDHLKRAGLFDDEAAAMLATWQRAYFQSPGLRLFFLVPRPWTDRHLPLAISQSAEITRVMVGRIELVSAEQRAGLRKLAAMELSKLDWLHIASRSKHAPDFFAGRSDFGDLGVAIPPDYQAYLALGRFRNALLVAEERRTRSTTLTKFIDQYNLSPFRVPDTQLPARAPGT